MESSPLLPSCGTNVPALPANTGGVDFEAPVMEARAFSPQVDLDGESAPQDHVPNSTQGNIALNQPREELGSSKAMGELQKECKMDWLPATERKSCLHILDLPVDVLREIVNQLPHTNDLTSLALTHSAFHNLTIPYIYSRFDIVWPDTSTHAEPRTGVDALTYGLATLVMAEDVFGEGQQSTSSARCDVGSSSSNSSTHSSSALRPQDDYSLMNRRRGNWYAQYTKKFSLGNGPADWVQEYLITKEGGKMLGTLVALAVARMRNLETFVWDMPTGILRDVWLALSSLANRRDGQPCRLERIWIRWHDNSQSETTLTPPPPPGPLSNLPHPPHGPPASVAANNPPIVAPGNPASAGNAMDRVEHPTFSVLPPMGAISVLDIDELPYLDEISILIGRSQSKLRELRIGIARHAKKRDWVAIWEGTAVQQVDYTTTRTTASKIGDKRLGGVMGILVGRTYDLRLDHISSSPSLFAREKEAGAGIGHNVPDNLQSIHQTEMGRGDMHHDSMDVAPDETLNQPIDPSLHPAEASLSPLEWASSAQEHPTQGVLKSPPTSTAAGNTMASNKQRSPTMVPTTNRRLKLEVMELERVPLAVFVLQRAFDWSTLTQLTLLGCQNHEHLWKSLRRTYTPQLTPSARTSALQGSSTRSSRNAALTRSDYALRLKKIHTNNVSSSLISFIRDALAPNSLECLFLQDERAYASTVTIENIYRGALRRHRSSLKKVLIESSERDTLVNFASSTRWRRWMLTREVLSFITSGNMPSLREIAFCIDYRDWHFFLQRLPSIPHVRSIYIPKIANHVHGNNIDSRELAMQVVDILTLRPDVEVCYLGIGEKCFEILENRSYEIRPEHNSAEVSTGEMPGTYGGNDPLVMTDDDTEDEDVDEDSDGDPAAMSGDESPWNSSDDHDSSDDDSFDHENERRSPRLRLREILFYDDKVAIFKARHGRL